MGGSTGSPHSRDFQIVDKKIQYVLPAKVLAMACVDLLYQGGSLANEIIGAFKPIIPPEKYAEFMHNLISKK